MTSLADAVVVAFLDEAWDAPPTGFTRKRMLLALAAQLEQVGSLMLCIDRPIRLVPVPPSGSRQYMAWLKRKGSLSREGRGLYLFQPWFFFHERLARGIPGGVKLNRAVLRAQIIKALHALNAKNRVPLAMIFHPYQEDMTGVCNEKLLLYECYDEYSAGIASEWQRRAIQGKERNILQQADLVFATSRQLYESRKAKNPDTYLIQNGVDYELFASSKGLADRFDTAMASIPHPRIGFTGAVWEIVDLELVISTATQRPHWQFVFVGPVDHRQTFRNSGEFQRSKALPNIHFLGVRPYESVPDYLASFDACILPYKRNEINAANYPLKLNEYLAAGKPVVSTDFCGDLQDFLEVVTLAPSTDDFEKALDQIIASPAPQKIERAREIARSNSWAARATQMVKHIEAKLSQMDSKS